MSNSQMPGGDPSATPPSSPPEAWAEDATVVIPSAPFAAPPGSDPSPFDAPPPANPLPPTSDPYGAPPAGPPEAPPWASGPSQGAPYQAAPYGAGPPPGLGVGATYGSVPPPGYIPSNPYAGTPYDVAPQGPYGAAPYGYGGLPTQTRTGIAVASLVCGIVGLVIALVPFFGLVGGLFALVAVPLGFIGLGAAKRQGGAGRGLAIGGIITGALAIVVCVAWFALIFVVGSTAEEDPYYYTEPMDGVCDEDRVWDDPDC